MNPISPITYCLRHKRQLITLTFLFTLIIAGTYLFIALAEETYISPGFTVNGYLDNFSIVEPELAKNLKQDVVSRISNQQGVDKVLQQTNIRIKIPNIGGAYFPFRLIGLKNTDIEYVINKCDLDLKDGKLPEPYTNGVVLSEEIVKSLNLKIGDTFDQTKNTRIYTNIETPLKLTGILTGGVRLGLMSYEFLNGDDIVSKFAKNGILVFSNPGHEKEVRNFLKNDIKDNVNKIYTNESKAEDVARDQKLLYQLGIPVVLMITFAFTLVIYAINKLFFTKRLIEFGTLYSIGRSRRWIVKRLTIESFIPASSGLVLGIVLANALMSILSITIYEPNGFSIQPLKSFAATCTLLIPIVIVISTIFNASGILKRMDAISIVEQSEFTVETKKHKPLRNKQNNRFVWLNSSFTYYKRHFKQAILITSTMLLMTISTALIIFIFSASGDAVQPALANFSKVSAVSPNGKPLDENLIEKIKSNPATKNVIPVYDFSPLKISIPPMFPNHPIGTYCVSSADMDTLVNLYELKLAEGHLPRDNSNEIVLPWAIAINRNLKIGTVIGNPDKPVYPNAGALPVDVVVSGIFAPSGKFSKETWLSFMSLKFVEPYKISPLSIIILPKDGQKDELDEWLLNDIAGGYNIVYTYDSQKNILDKEMRTMFFTFSSMEGIIVLLSSFVLAGLFSSFLFQRKKELGILQALGFTRKNLLIRILCENMIITGVAWIASLVLCLVSLILLKYGIYDKIGLRINFFNPVPWLFTLPVPLMGIISSAVTTIKILSGIDPLDIIERR